MYIKEYQIGNKIHEDVIGQIYIANTTDLERAVFFKILHERYLSHPELVQAFHECAEILGTFEDENQLRMIEHGEENGRHYIIFEYFNLAPLEKIVLKKNVLSLIDASNVIEKIAAILRNYHLEGFIHGSLTPQNIFIDDELTMVKIGDFGFNQFIRLLIKKKERGLSDVLPYYSPELTQSSNLDRRSDIYSLGVLFYRMITGLLPWSESTSQDFDGATRPLSLIPPSLQRLEVPDYLDTLILKMLDPDLEKRFQNLSQFIKHFANAKASILASITPVTPQVVREYPTDKSQAFLHESTLEEELNDRGSHDEPSQGQKKVVEANASRPGDIDKNLFTTPADETRTIKVAELPKTVGSDAQVQKSAGPPKATEAVAEFDHLSKFLNEKVSLPPQPSSTKPNNGASKVEKSLPQNVNVPTAARGKPAGKVSNIKKENKPAPAFAGTREVTATQTEEFATTQTINLQGSQMRGLSISSLLKFVFLPILMLMVLYVGISFLDLEWTAGWPNFKNSILFQKIQMVLQSKNKVRPSPNKVREIRKGSKSRDAAPIKAPQTEQAETNSPNLALDSRTNSLRTGNGTETNSSTAPPKSAAADRVTLKILVKSGTSPLGAEVYIDDRFLGKTTSQGQMTISNLALGTSYLIQIKSRGFQIWANQVSFNKAGTVNLNVELTALANGKTGAPAQPPNKQKTGTVTVLLSNPLHLSNAFVYINGQLWSGPENVAPAKVALASGRYLIEVKKDGFRCQPFSQTVEVAAGKDTTVTFLLVPN